MAHQAYAQGPPAAAGPLSPPLERAVCVLVVASAIKMPLGIPLYLNTALLLVGAFAVCTIHALDRIFLWMLALLACGLAAAAQQGTLALSAPRLLQVVALVFAADLVARLDPTLLARYLLVLLLLIVTVGLAETFLPLRLYEEREVLGAGIARYAGLHGEPNYNAMLYGVVGMILAQHPPRLLGALPFLAALPSLSRGVVAALAAWLGGRALGRRLVPLALPLALLLCLQPVLVLAVDGLIDDDLRAQLARWSSNRYPLWVGYARLGLAQPLGAGYFAGPEAVQQYWHTAREAHSVFLQVFGEFGWVGHLLFTGFLLHVTRRIARRSAGDLPLLLFVLTGYAFLNGLSDWAFWVPLGYLLARARLAAAAPVTP